MGDNFVDQFWDTIEDQGLTLDMSQSHMAVFEHLNKMMEVQEVYNTENSVIQCDQDMVEMQNRLGYRNPDVASNGNRTITGGKCQN